MHDEDLSIYDDVLYTYTASVMVDKRDLRREFRMMEERRRGETSDVDEIVLDVFVRISIRHGPRNPKSPHRSHGAPRRPCRVLGEKFRTRPTPILHVTTTKGYTRFVIAMSAFPVKIGILTSRRQLWVRRVAYQTRIFGSLFSNGSA